MPFSIAVGHAQRDGRRYVLEVHSDGGGEFARLEYLAAEGADHNAVAAARELMLLESAAEQEFQSAVDGDVMPVLRFQNPLEFRARMRREFRSRERESLCRLARWILNRITAGDLTDAQVRNAFGMGVPDYTLFKTRMTTLRDALNSVEGAVGE